MSEINELVKLKAGLEASGSTKINGTFAPAQLADNTSGSGVTLVDPAVMVYTLINNSLASINGITAPVDGSAKTVTYNNATANTVYFNNATGTAANQIITGNNKNLDIISGGSITLRYDTANSKWRVISTSASIIPIDPIEVAEIPPSLDLDFSTELPPTVTFSRNSIATYFAQDGYLKTASANVPRIEHDPVTRDVKGLLIEEARSNLLKTTEQPWDTITAQWGKVNVSIGANSITAPDGSLTASLVVGNTTSNVNKYTYNAISTTTTGIYTGTHFLKAGTATSVVVRLNDTTGANGAYVTANLSAGTIGSVTQEGANTNSSATITAVSDGWYRVSVTTTFVSALTGIQCAAWLKNYGGTTDTTYFYLWGAQLEAGSFPTSYIPSQETWTARTGTGGTAVASYYDSTGVLKYTGVARTTYNPSPDKLHLSPKLLLEPEATNLLLQSEDFNTTWSTTNVTVTTNNIVAPDGNTTADRIVDTATTSGHYVYSSTSGLSSNGVYTVSAFVKFDSASRNLFFETTDAPSGGTGYATILMTPTGVITVQQAGTFIVVNSSAIQLPNNWYRVSLSFQIFTVTTIHTRIGMADASNNKSYLGNGSGIFIWGAQLEAGYAPTSYIPTTTATVKRYADTYTSAVLSGGRLADNASMTGSNFSGWYRWDEGTVYCEADKPISASGVYNYRFAISNGTNQNNIYSANWSTEERILVATTNNIIQAYIFSATNNPTTMIKYTSAFKLNDFAAYSGSGVSGSDTSGLMPSVVNKLSIGSDSAGTAFYLNGHIRRLIFWPLRISNDKLQKMTV